MTSITTCSTLHICLPLQYTLHFTIFTWISPHCIFPNNLYFCHIYNFHISPPLTSMTKVKMSRYCPKIVKTTILFYAEIIFIQSSKIVFRLSIPLFHVSLVDLVDVIIARQAYNGISTALIYEYKNFVYVSLLLTHSSSCFSTKDSFKAIDSLKSDVLFKICSF